MARIGQNMDEQRRDLFKAAALKKSDDGTLVSRVDEATIRAALITALSKEGALALRVFSKGSVGAQVRVSLDVANEEGDEFSLSGQVLLTIPETVVK